MTFITGFAPNTLVNTAIVIIFLSKLHCPSILSIIVNTLYWGGEGRLLTHGLTMHDKKLLRLILQLTS